MRVKVTSLDLIWFVLTNAAGQWGRGFAKQLAPASDCAIRSLRKFAVTPVAAIVAGSLVLLITAIAGAAELRLEVRDVAGRIVPARIHLQTSAGEPVRAPALPFWRDHFVCTGAVTLALAPGKYRWEIERGPEWSVAAGSVALAEGGTRSFTNTIRRVVDLPSEGWWSGETHVHREPADAELLMRAEDLHVAHVITWWNKANRWSDTALPETLPLPFDVDRFRHPLGGEDERDGGALLYMDLPAPLDISGGTRHFPSSLVYARQARAGGAKWIDAEKPFWWDFPMWVAHGVVDTVGIAHNHFHRGGVLDNEAWGRPRDRAKYPGPQGNGRYTQDIYYHLLNAGVRVAPSAGSASGVLPNPVGYNRAFVRIEGAFTYEKWRDGLKAGRSFVSNGPLLRGHANGLPPGQVFRTNGALQVLIDARIGSRDPLAAVELVQNGRIERVELPARITIRESGWFLLRAVADVTNTFRFASSAPWYVELDGKPAAPRRESARFFADWCRERMDALRTLASVNASQREELLQPWQVAETFWQNKVAASSGSSR